MHGTSLNTEQLGTYLAAKQSLIEEFKGRSYDHAVAIINAMMFFKHPESLFARMKIYTPTLIASLVKNRFLIQAPFQDGKLIYIAKEIFPYFYYYEQKEVEYKHRLSGQVLAFINQEGMVQRSQIIKQFGILREKAMEILTELRNQFKIIMYYDNARWLIYSPSLVLPEEKMSRGKAFTKLVHAIIKNYGPITIPQIISMLGSEGGLVSKSIIELYENKMILKGNFIEGAMYESFVSSDELDKMKQFIENYTYDKHLVILPSSDLLVKYWNAASFFPRTEFHSMVIFESGLPVFSFDYKIDKDKLYITKFTRTAFFSHKEERILAKLREFAENLGKFAVLPQLESELLKNQAEVLAHLLLNRGYYLTNAGLTLGFQKHKTTGQLQKHVSISNLIPLLFEIQHLSSSHQLSSGSETKKAIRKLGVPLPVESIHARVRQGKERIVNDLIVQKELLLGSFGQFKRGAISTEDFDIYAKLLPSRHTGVLEERVLKIIKTKGRVTLAQLRKLISLSDKMLKSSLLKLEKALLIARGKSVKGETIWLPIEDYLKNKAKRRQITQKEAWVEIIRRILETNLPLTVTQIANITGLSNTQVETYLKELIASKGIKTGHFIEEITQTQFTTKEIESKISGYILETENVEHAKAKSRMELTYIPHNDPVLVLYKDYLCKGFNIKSLLLRPLPNEYADLVLIGNSPFAAIHFKRINSIEVIHNIEVIGGYSNDNYLIMLLLTKIREHLAKTRPNVETTLEILNFNNLPLSSPTNTKIRELLNNL